MAQAKAARLQSRRLHRWCGGHEQQMSLRAACLRQNVLVAKIILFKDDMEVAKENIPTYCPKSLLLLPVLVNNYIRSN